MGPQRFDDVSPLSVVGALLLGLAMLLLGMYLLTTWYPSNVSSEPLVVWRSAGQIIRHAAESGSQGRAFEARLNELSRNPAADAVRHDVTVVRSR